MRQLIHGLGARDADAVRAIKTLAVAGLALGAAVVAGWWVAPQYGVDALRYFVVGLGAVAFATVVFHKPIVGVVVVAFLIPTEAAYAFGEIGQGGTAVTLVRVVGLLVFAAWGVRKLVTRESWTRVFSGVLWKAAFLFVLLSFTSLLWATKYSPELFTTAQLLALALIVTDVVRSRKHQEWMIKALVLGGLAALFLTFGQGFFRVGITTALSQEIGERAGVGVAGGINATAIIVVILIPLAFYLLRTSQRRLWRVVGFVYVALAPLGLAQTVSRISFAVLPVLLGLQIWLIARERVRNLAYIWLGGLAVGVLLLATVDWETVIVRGKTILPAFQGELREDTETTWCSRCRVWFSAVAMFEDHPIIGVGYGNYGHNMLNTYQFEVPREWVINYTTHPQNSHSTLLGILAELGLIGAALWAWLMAAAVVSARRSWSAHKGANDRNQALLAQAVFLSLVAYLMYSPFAFIHLDKLLWVLFGLTEVSRRLALDHEERAGPSEDVAVSASAVPTA